MPNLYSWWKDNAFPIMVIIGWCVLIVAFAINIRDRVERLEQVGSPQVAAIDKRLSLIEQKIGDNNQLQQDTAHKVDDLTHLVQKHLLGDNSIKKQ